LTEKTCLALIVIIILTKQKWEETECYSVFNLTIIICHNNKFRVGGLCSVLCVLLIYLLNVERLLHSAIDHRYVHTILLYACCNYCFCSVMAILREKRFILSRGFVYEYNQNTKTNYFVTSWFRSSTAY
jgi:hypothetical protein